MMKKTDLSKSKDENEDKACPHCGYCPHCGRSNAQPPYYVFPYIPTPYVAPYYPWISPPYYVPVQRPYFQYTPTSGYSQTISNLPAGSNATSNTWTISSGDFNTTTITGVSTT